MSDNHDPQKAGDYRRAALLTKYHRLGNKTGMIAIVDETNEAGRVPELLRSVMVLHQTFISRFRTDDGIQLLGDWIGGMAELEPDDDDQDGTDLIRAARIFNYDGQGNHDGVAATISAATADGRMTQTLLKLLDHYEVALPELSGQAGIEFIDANAAAMLDVEYNPDDADG